MKRKEREKDDTVTWMVTCPLYKISIFLQSRFLSSFSLHTFKILPHERIINLQFLVPHRMVGHIGVLDGSKGILWLRHRADGVRSHLLLVHRLSSIWSGGFMALFLPIGL